MHMHRVAAKRTAGQVGGAVGHACPDMDDGRLRPQRDVGADAAEGADPLGEQAAHGQQVWHGIALQRRRANNDMTP